MGEGGALFFALDSLSLFKTEILVMLRSKISFHFDFPTPCNPGTHEVYSWNRYLSIRYTVILAFWQFTYMESTGTKWQLGKVLS